MAININQVGFQGRLDAIQRILGLYGLQSMCVTPVEYDENCPFPFNNFIYKIELSEPAMPSAFARQPARPGTTLPPETGISSFIVRLSNPHADGLNNVNRVENEVAAQHLFRRHLSANHPDLVHILPAIYAWAPCRYPEVPDETSFAWTLCEYMQGANLDIQFAEMDAQQKLGVVEQVADIFAALQGTPLPQGVTGHVGGLTFTDDGQVVRGQMSLLPPGPWSTLEEFWVARLRYQLSDADKSSALNGWKGTGIRERIEEFINGDKIVRLLAGVDTTRRALVHGDLTMNNMLYSKTARRITALLDFDWASVLHPSHEFFAGLWDLGGGTHPSDAKLQAAILTGQFANLRGTLSSEEEAEWNMAKAWDSALAKRGAIRPCSIRGIENLEKLRHLEELLCPFQLGNETMIERIKKRDPASLKDKKNDAAASLISMLENMEV